MSRGLLLIYFLPRWRRLDDLGANSGISLDFDDQSVGCGGGGVGCSVGGGDTKGDGVNE